MRVPFSTFALVAALAIAPAAQAQDCPVSLFESVEATPQSVLFVLRAGLTVDLPGMAPAGSLTATIAGAPVTLSTNLTVPPYYPRSLSFAIAGRIEADTQVRAQFTALKLKECTLALPHVEALTVPSIEQALGRLLAHAKTTDEKSVFGSFVAVRGEGGSTDGAADIVVNRDLAGGNGPNLGALFDTAFATLVINKSSAENGDPREFHVGVTLEKTRFLGAARGYLQCSAQGDCDAALQQMKDETGFTRLFRTLLLDEAVRLESDAFAFQSVNFVSDSHLQLASVAKAIGHGGYVSVRLHGGAELGRSLQKPVQPNGTAQVPTSTVDWIRRGKGGVEASLRLLPGRDPGGSWGVELSYQGIARHLLTDEVFIEDLVTENNQTVSNRVSVGRGTKGWQQVDAKVFLLSTPTARYGVRLAYMKGSLPPSFKSTKAFQFGFMIESADDSSSGQPASGSAP